MKRLAYLIFLLLLGCQSSVWAGVVKGKVLDEHHQPLEFVNVALYEQGNTVPYKGTVTDESGQFVIDGVKDGSYVMKLSFMGYVEIARNVKLSADNRHTANFNYLELKEDRAVLQEVSISTQKAAMKLDIDKKVFDVSQNITTAGLSASEALENIPSVEVDQEGNISLRGSQSVTVWINGKAQGMTSDNRGSILQQLPAESIERIEVITNPSSKYSPEGSAGIINIILKRDRKAGYYGGVQLNAGKQQRQDPSGRFGANINYSSGILEAYANIGLGRRVRNSHGFTDRDFVDETNGYHYGYLNSTNEGGGKNQNLFARAGVTWHFTETDEIGINYMGMLGLGDNGRTSSYDYEQGLYDPSMAGTYVLPSYISHRESYNSDEPRMNNMSLTYRHTWDTNHTLDASFSLNHWQGNNETGYDQQTTTLLNLGGSNPTATSTQWQESRISNRRAEAQIDYEQPLSETAKLEAGYKGNWSHENSPTETWSDKTKAQSLYSLFNRFIYDQTIQALYANYQNRIGKRFGYQVGLRAEYWQTTTESYNYDQEYPNAPGYPNLPGVESVPKYKKNFFQLFPTVFLSYQLPADQELQLNFTRRLQRPWGGQLNSFKNINDSTSISFGNPALTPTYTNSFEFNYLKNWEEHTLSVSAYYRPSSDVMQQIAYQKREGENLDKLIRYQTQENISKEVSSGLEIIGKNKIFSFLDLTTTVNAFYYKLEGGEFHIKESADPIRLKGSDDFSWNASMMGQFTLPWQLALQATGRYNAAKIIAQGKREANYSLDLGLRRSFFDKKLTVNLNARNVLDSRKFRSRTSAPGYTQLSESAWGGRRFGIQISYNFGNMRGKEGRRDRQGQGDSDESSGMGGGYEGGGGDF